MKLIIDIPKDYYESAKEKVANGNTYAVKMSIANGIPLDDVKADIDQYLFQNEFGSEYRKEVSQILDNIGKESEDT